MKTFYERLESFKNYNGCPNPILLAKNDFYHTEKDIIVCKKCSMKFISWNLGEKFWVKHNESICIYIDDDYKYFGSDNSTQTVAEWMKKKYVKNLIENESFNYEQIYNALRSYLYLKGDFASLKTFKEYIFYLQYFKKINLTNRSEKNIIEQPKNIDPHSSTSLIQQTNLYENETASNWEN